MPPLHSTTTTDTGTSSPALRENGQLAHFEQAQHGLRGTLRPAADKSISHRSALLAAMSSGETEIRHYLDSADTRSTLGAIEKIGATVNGAPDSVSSTGLSIDGVGLTGARNADVNVGNASTLFRLLSGWLSGQHRGEWLLDGDSSIRSRPMDRIAMPLGLMGADVECRDGVHPPMSIRGVTLHGIDYELPVASAQVKSCLLFAGLVAEGETTIVEKVRSRDHTERMLAALGADLEISATESERRIRLKPIDKIEPGTVDVPADLSSAAFFIAAAALVPGSEVELTDVGINETRTGLLDILGRMGADLDVEPVGELSGEPIARIVARHSRLRGTTVRVEEVPRAIDELTLVALLGAFAEGETRVEGAGELRHKESDRIQGVVEGLSALGASIEELRDGFVVTGSTGLTGGVLDSHNDHRLAMLGAIAGLASRGPVKVQGFDAAAVSYPGFEADLLALLQP